VIKAMFLSKLKAVWVLLLAISVSAGAVGLSYRAVAAPPGQSGDKPQAVRAVADELEELRLEVAALRKGLETTRQRVKTLEDELQTLKGRAANADRVRKDLPGEAGGRLFRHRDGWVEEVKPEGAGWKFEEVKPEVPLGKFVEVKPEGSLGRFFVDVDRDGQLDVFVEQPNSALAEAEAALKKLRANANDKQAADALEKALKQLKLQMAATDLKRAKQAPKKPAKP
jgi:hypothetical protein